MLWLELAMISLGIYSLTTGQLRLSSSHLVQGTAARVLGIVAILPLPIAFCIGFFIGAQANLRGQQLDAIQPTLVAIEAGLIVVCVAVVFGVGYLLAENPALPHATRREESGSSLDEQDDAATEPGDSPPLSWDRSESLDEGNLAASETTAFAVTCPGCAALVACEESQDEQTIRCLRCRLSFSAKRITNTRLQTTEATGVKPQPSARTVCAAPPSQGRLLFSIGLVLVAGLGFMMVAAAFWYKNRSATVGGG